MSEEPSKEKKTRRAARRAQQDNADSKKSTSSESKRSTEKGAAKTKRRKVAESGATSSIRDERLRAREAGVARRRKKRARERAQAAAEGLDTGELVDDALARGVHATSRFVQRNFRWLQWVIILGAAGGFGKLIYDYRTELDNQKASKRLVGALHDQLGEVEDETDLNPAVPGFAGLRPEYPSDTARLKAAADAYRKAIAEDDRPARKTLAQLGLAGVLFDQGKYKDAQQTYAEVKASKLAADDIHVKGRAVEGAGLSLEALGKRDEAGKVFKELENIGNRFRELGQYHRARLLYEAGERDKAKELLKKVREKADKESLSGGQSFVQVAAQQLLEAIDPAAARPAPGAGLSPEQLKQIQEQLQKAAGLKGKPGGAGTDMKELTEAIKKKLNEQGTPPEAPSPSPEERAAPPKQAEPGQAPVPETQQKQAPAGTKRTPPPPQAAVPVAPKPPPVQPEKPAAAPPPAPRPAPVPAESPTE